MRIRSLSPLALLFSLVNSACYHPSPAFPLPDLNPSDPTLRDAFARINTAAVIQVAGPEYAGHSYSIEVTSSKQSLWSSHHTAREKNKDGRGTAKVDGDSLYRIASITKTFTVLGILYQAAAGNLSLDDTVDMYVKGLRGKGGGEIPWKDITVRSLASQLSGIPREFAQADLLNILEDPTRFGLPPIDRKGLPKCDEYGNYHPCSLVDLIDSVTSKPPLFAPNSRSTYSNVAFELLGLVLESVTGQRYDDYIQAAIFDTLNMTQSAVNKPRDEDGVIPNGSQFWDIDLGIQSPTGAIYSSSTDLSKWLRYILSHYNRITNAVNWLQPASWGEGMQSFYGMPWEIFRTDEILEDSRRPVTFVSKSGGLPGYTSIIYLLPEYDIGITILVAGGEAPLLSKLSVIVTVEIIRAAENVALKQLERYSGTYEATKPALNSSITLSVDCHGLAISHFISNGTDMTSLISKLSGIDGPYRAQLTPTLLFKDEKMQQGELWRLQVVPEKIEKKGNEGIWDSFCVTSIDAFSYGGLPVQEVVFWSDEGKQVERADLTGFRVKLKRQGVTTFEEPEQQRLG